MRKVFVSSAIALAMAGLPVAAAAQNAPANPQIVVSGKFQKDWDKGSKLEAEGLKDLQQAQRDLVGYSADVVNAQDKRDTSNKRAENARDAFQNLTARPFFSDPEEARKWAKQVESAATDWAKFDARREDGAKELRKAQDRQADAQKAVDKAQDKIDRGRTLMADAERASVRQSSR